MTGLSHLPSDSLRELRASMARPLRAERARVFLQSCLVGLGVAFSAIAVCGALAFAVGSFAASAGGPLALILGPPALSAAARWAAPLLGAHEALSSREDSLEARARAIDSELAYRIREGCCERERAAIDPGAPRARRSPPRRL